MPKLNDTGNLEQFQQGHFGFSAVRVEDLGASEYTLVTLLVDTSGSTSGFLSEMEACIQNVVEACSRSPRADNLMIRLLSFDDSVKELHGYKLLQDCNVGGYKGVLKAGGMTALYDATCNGVQAAIGYAQTLAKNDFTANGLVIVVTDGGDNRSIETRNSVKAALESAVKSESLESLLSILVGVNVTDSSVATYLSEFKKEANFDQYVELGNADPKTLAKLADFVSRSISSQSQSLGTGGPSKPLTF